MSSPASGRFADKVAIVTGGSGDIGRATARLRAPEGAAVTVADLSEECGRGHRAGSTR